MIIMLTLALLLAVPRVGPREGVQTSKKFICHFGMVLEPQLCMLNKSMLLEGIELINL